jgi:hypothetical protein
MTFYGSLTASPEDILNGDGGHIGTTSQAVDRMYALFQWFSHRWDAFPDVGVGSDPGSVEERQTIQTFSSTSLGVDRDFSLALPPGYGSPENANARYPVVYILHGYGMDPLAMMAIEVLFDADMQTGDMRKMISVFPSGLCCLTNTQTGEHACTEYQPNGDPWPSQWVPECNQGNFFVNSQGGPNGPPRAYMDSFVELTKYIDQNYRTLAATGGTDVPVSQ